MPALMPLRQLTLRDFLGCQLPDKRFDFRSLRPTTLILKRFFFRSFDVTSLEFIELFVGLVF
jgi:hypothetical protein